LTTIHLNIWLGIHLTRLSTEGLGPRHGEVRRAHQMLNAALRATVAVNANGDTGDSPPAIFGQPGTKCHIPGKVYQVSAVAC